jgi:hypothetical protein
MGIRCWFFECNYDHDPSKERSKNFYYWKCKHCDNCVTEQTEYGKQQQRKKWSEEKYEREHFADHGVKVLWNEDRDAIAIVPHSYLKRYLYLTDARTAATFVIDTVDDENVKVTYIWNPDQ